MKAEDGHMIGRTISHYRIVEKLGEGGMGVVYVGEDTVLRRRVAIKTLTTRGGDNQHFRTRFLREARAVSALSHPHIAHIYDYGETEDDEPYIVMELIKGTTLGDLMAKEALTIPRAIGIVKQVAEALGEAHRNGIVHRDIKPSNVAINDRGNVKVLDFGLAKQIELGGVDSSDPERQTLLNTQTREGVIVGTPMYLSPEQALGVDVDARSDLFALGGLLYECIAGKPAFSGGSPVEICAQIIREDPPPPSQLNSNVSREMDRIALKALKKKPEERYQSADEMIADLRAVEESVSRGSDRTVTRLISSTSGTQPTGAIATLSDIFKRPRLSIGYVVAALAIVVLLVLGIWWWNRPRFHVPPAEAQKLYDTGTEAIRNGSYFQASKALQQAIASDDQFALAHARLAEAWTELDYIDKAKDEMLRVSDLRLPGRTLFTPVDQLYLDAVTATVRRDFARAIEAYSEIARQQPGQSPAYVDLGRAYEKNNQSAKAIESYLKATTYDSQNAAAFLRRGVLYGRQRDMDKSKAAFDKAEEIYQTQGNVEGRTEVVFQQGVLLNDIAGQVDEARAKLEQAREMAKVVNSRYQQIRILFQLSNVALKQGKTDEAEQYAREAVELAQANQMETLAARGLNEIGNVYFGRGAHPEAERHFQQALEISQRFGARQTEARARLSLASLYVQRGEADRALQFQEQALPFFQAGGYRTEVSQALTLRGRIHKLKGDYAAAMQAYQQEFQLAEQAGDKAQLAYSHNSLGNLLFDMERFAEALDHFEKNYSIYKSMGNTLYTGYAHLNRGVTKWQLGRNDDARADLDEASAIAEREGTGFKELQAFISLREAQISLGARQFNEAMAKSRKAIDLTGAKDKVVAIRGKYQLGLSQALSGQLQAGQANCREATEMAALLGDPLLLARAELALAEASLAAGDAQLAITNAQKARTFFASAGLSEAEWRAWIFEGFATERVGDREKARHCLKRASEVLASLQQKWGSDVFESYVRRPDVQAYSKSLENA